MTKFMPNVPSNVRERLAGLLTLALDILEVTDDPGFNSTTHVLSISVLVSDDLARPIFRIDAGKDQTHLLQIDLHEPGELDHVIIDRDRMK